MRSSVPVDKQGRTTSHSQVRRFDVKTFAFVDPQTGLPSTEEVRSSPPASLRHTAHARDSPHARASSFASRFTSTAGWKSAPRTPTALSSAPSFVSAFVSAFAAAVLVLRVRNSASPPPASEGDQQRRRRATTSESDKVQLVSVGPLLIPRNGTQVEETPCAKQKKSERGLVVKCLSMPKRSGIFDCISVPQWLWWQCTCSLLWQPHCYWSWSSPPGWATGSRSRNQSRTATHRMAVTNINKVYLHCEAFIVLLLCCWPPKCEERTIQTFSVMPFMRLITNSRNLKHWFIVGKIFCWAS